MDEWKFNPDFEKNIRASFAVPEISPVFMNRLQKELSRKAENKMLKQPFFRLRRPAWALVGFLITLTIAGILVIGPQRVLAEVLRLFGYIPGVGIVDQSNPIRVLVDPAQVTRDDITLTVTDTVLTEQETIVLFTLEGVPWQALSHQENVPGCWKGPELSLPDGTILQLIEGGGSAQKMRFVYPPISKNINQVDFILPCIQNTLPGLAPENWRLPLRFIPAPPDYSMLPVIELPVNETETDAIPQVRQQPLAITKILEVDENYLIFGEFDPRKSEDTTAPGAVWQPIGALQGTDSAGSTYYLSYLPELNTYEPSDPQVETFMFKISKYVLSPLKITYPGIYVQKVGEPQQFRFEWDAGTSAQPGQEWVLNKDINVDGYSVRLVSITANQQGYSFTFDHNNQANLFEENTHVISPKGVEIEGYTVAGGGGGGGTLSLDYVQRPVGKLTFVVTVQHNQSLQKKTWEFTWQPHMKAVQIYDIALVVDKYVPLNDGYYLVGHTQWNDQRVETISEYGTMKAYDTSGKELRFEKASFAVTSTLIDALQPNQWVYHLYGKDIDFPITLRLDKVLVLFQDPATFKLDLRQFGFAFREDQVGLYWKTGLIPVDLPGLSTSVNGVKYVRQNGFSGFEFRFTVDPNIQNLGLDYKAGVENEKNPRRIEVQTDQVNQQLVISLLSDGQFSMPLELIVGGADISGLWEASWAPSR